MEVEITPFNLRPESVHLLIQILRCLSPLLLQCALVLLKLRVVHSLDLPIHLAQERVHTLLEVEWITLALHDDADTRLSASSQLPLRGIDDIPELFSRSQDRESRLGENMCNERCQDLPTRVRDLAQVDVVGQRRVRFVLVGNRQGPGVVGAYDSESETMVS